MRIQTITANNFKSLVDFKIDLAKFNCLVGLNGCGKSTVLQFIDFVAQLVRGDIRAWLKERSWRATELNSRISAKKNIDLFVELVKDDGGAGVWWEASFNIKQLHCTSETIKTPGARLEVRNGQLRIVELAEGQPNREATTEKISFSYEGSILSQLRQDVLPSSLIGFRNYFAGIKSLDLLSPEQLRQRTREPAGSLGLGGQRLSAFLHELGNDRKRKLVELLKKVYPQLEDIHTKALKSGWKQLEITEKYEGRGGELFPQMTTEARHINDGMLRLIAILAELQSDHRFLLFDEIENGINPELVEFVLDALTSTDKQVLVTTHSPMILNYLSDEVAKESVAYLYKTREGATQAIPFFSIPSLAEKLTVMGPGEAFVDTDVTTLSEEIQSVMEEH